MMYMITLLIVGIIALFFIAIVVMIPFAAVKQAKMPKTQCPKCENEVKFYKSPMKCPMCKAKVYKHGDGSYKLQN